MVGLVNTLRDTALIVKTDKRFWAAGGFLGIVLTTWLCTSSWRGLPDDTGTHVFEPKVKRPYMHETLVDFQKDLVDGAKNRKDLVDMISRTDSELQASSQKTEWNTHNIINKLDTIATRVDKLVKEVGTRNVQNAEVDRSIMKHNRKQKQVRAVDPGEN